MKEKNTIVVSIIVETNDDGYLASVPDIQGAFAEGDTVEEAIFNCVDVLKMIFAFRRERGEPSCRETGGSFDFLNAPEEDIYSDDDLKVKYQQ